MNTIQNMRKTLMQRSRFVWQGFALAAALVAGTAADARGDQLQICDEQLGNNSDSQHPMYQDFIRSGLTNGQCATGPDASCWTGANWANGLTYTFGRSRTCRSGTTYNHTLAVLGFGNLRAARTTARPHCYVVGVVYDAFDNPIGSVAGPADSSNWSAWLPVSVNSYSYAAFGYIY
jgi:hypothetical protein